MNGIWWLALAAGAAAALPKKQQHNLMKLPSFRGVAEGRASLGACACICPPFRSSPSWPRR